MGMAASQARLLALTARIHDVEFQAQTIQNAKLQLATQSDEVYKDYLEALDATTLTVKDLEGARHIANFNSLCSINRVDSGYTYALKNTKEQLIVSDEIYEGYHDFMDSALRKDAHTFALFMMMGEDNDLTTEEDAKLLKDYEKKVQDNHIADNVTLAELYEKYCEFLPKHDADSIEDLKNKSNGDKLYKEYINLEKEYYNKLYSAYGQEIFSEYSQGNIDIDSDTFDSQFNYYESIYNQIQDANGCVSIDSYDGFNGNAANDAEWLTSMIQCGKISISIIEKDRKTGDVDLVGTSPASDTYLEYTTITEIDKAALAKAEAEYEHKTKTIDKKDQKFDLDLSKLETERKALTTQYESVKKVIQENIDRSFGIFS